MDKTRVAFTVEVDLDPIPGWGDNEEDWRIHIMQRLGLFDRGHDGSLLPNTYRIEVRYGGVVHQSKPYGEQIEELAREITQEVIMRKKVFTQVELADMTAEERQRLAAALPAHDWKTLGLNPPPVDPNTVQVTEDPESGATIVTWEAPDEQ